MMRFLVPKRCCTNKDTLMNYKLLQTEEGRNALTAGRNENGAHVRTSGES